MALRECDRIEKGQYEYQYTTQEILRGIHNDDEVWCW